MKKTNRLHEAGVALGARSRHEAERQRKNVAPDRLAAAITDFIEWRAFAYWVRLMAEKKWSPASQVEPVLRDRCPGFLETGAEHRRSHQLEHEFVWLQLIDWIDDHVFEDAKSEGWQHALGFYAARDERLDRIRAYWLKCDEQWDEHPPPRPPEYHEWHKAALQPI